MDSQQDLNKHLANCASLHDILDLSTELLSNQTDSGLMNTILHEAEKHCHKPIDYLQLADFALSHDVNEFAEQLYQGIEQLDASPTDLIKAADRMILANYTEKAELFLKHAASQSYNATDLFLVATTAKKSLGNNSLAKELLFGNQHKIKNLDDHINLCRCLIREGDKKLAKELFAIAKHDCSDAITKINYAHAVNNLFNDVEWAKKIFAEAETDCENTKDFVALARSYHSLLKDKKKAAVLIEQAEHVCELDQEHIELGNGYWELLNDKERAITNFQKAIPGITDKETLLQLAKNAINFGDSDLAKTIYAKSEQYMSSSSELCKLAQSIVNDLNDTEYALEIYKRADRNTSVANDLINLANEVIFHINNKQLARSIYERAYENSTNHKQLLTLLDYVEINIEDKEFANKILKKAEQLAEDTEDLLEVSTQILSVLDYKEFAREVTQSAEDRVSSVNDMNSLVKHVTERFGDDIAWSNELSEKLARFKSNKAK